MSIDWSKAPEWAKGHGLVVQGAIKQVWFGDRAYMIVGDSRSYVYGGGSGETRHNHMPDAIQHKTARPAAWTGEGLPPVGTVCEINHKNLGWVRCEIVAHKNMDCGGKPHAIAWIDGNTLDQSQGIRFRPIRTPEQIAADERLHEVRNALTTIKAGQSFPGDLVRGNIVAATVEAMIDAGYRKQVKP